MSTNLLDPLTEKQIITNKVLIDKAILYAPYAIFSNNAYNRGENALPLPEGWTENGKYRSESHDDGFAIAVFEKHENGRLVEVSVAFRGTDGLSDWINQNLFPFHREQVPTAVQQFKEIQTDYKKQNVKITATGHSLGGGLAVHMSFTNPHIDAIVFNSSPITKAGNNPITTNTIVSIWESGDILQIPRNVINLIRPRWWRAERIEFRFVHGLPIMQHGMDRLALNMVKLGAVKSEPLRDLLTQYCNDNA